MSRSADNPTANIRVGTASWSEPEFVKAGWYPPGLPAGRRLPFYAERFDQVVLELRHHDWLGPRHREQTTAFLRELA